ncbi:MAG: hypothetical protein GY818_20715 [Planctomycetaceae bacterium]|nr:hypothetical protein [Planctomycetaceae bacterium]
MRNIIRQILVPHHIGRPAIASSTEQLLVRGLRNVLQSVDVGDQIVDSKDPRRAMSFLEYFIPEILREVHSEWKHEGLDGVCPEIVTKTAKCEIEIIGSCIVLSDQAVLPSYILIRVSATDDVIESMECKLGELIGDTMKRVPYGSKSGVRKPIASHVDLIKWAYHVGFGATKP